MTDLLIVPAVMNSLLDGLIQKTIDGKLKWKVPGLYDDSPAPTSVAKKGKKGPPIQYADEDELCISNVPSGPHTHYIKFGGRTLSVTRSEHSDTVLQFRTKVGVDNESPRGVAINLTLSPDGLTDGVTREPDFVRAQIREYNLKVQLLCAAIDSYRNSVQVLEDGIAADANRRAGETTLAALGELLK